MSSKESLYKKAELFRRTSSAAKASKHRQPLERGFSKDITVCDEGRQLDCPPGVVRSDDSDPEIVEQERTKEDRSDSSSDGEGRDHRRSPPRRTRVRADAPVKAPRVLGLPRKQRPPNIACGGPLAGRPCASCAWAYKFLSDGACILVESESEEFGLTEEEEAALAEGSTGAWENHFDY